MTQKVCINCDEVRKEEPVVHCPKYICSVDGREVDPFSLGCCLWGNYKDEVAQE